MTKECTCNYVTAKGISRSFSNKTNNIGQTIIAH